MTLRYLAIIDAGGGHPAAAHAFAAAASAPVAGLVERVSTGSLTVLTDPRTDCIGLEPGLIVGRVFPHAPWSSPERLPARIRQSGGRLLTDGYWGDYVAFVPDHDVVRVIRAPCGDLHAYRATHDGLVFITSDVELLLSLGVVQARIDWSFVAHHLAFPHLRGAPTGIAGVDELFPGDCTIVGRSGAERSAYWSPWRFTAPDQRFTDAGEAASAVRRDVVTAVASLAAPYRSILLELSGGLDSSIVAAALQQSKPRAAALNLATPGREGDERHYARLVAQRTGLPLEETVIGGTPDLTAPVHARTPRPGLPAMLQGADAYFVRAAQGRGAEAFFSGTGGDSVFCALGSAAPATDALRTFGPGPTFFHAVRDVTAVHGTNIWKVGLMALRQAGRRQPRGRWPRSDTFLNGAAVPDEPLFHPWLDEPPGTLDGSRSHLRSIMAAMAHLDGYARHMTAPSVFPLLAQPVVETCLRIPSWMWVAGGHDRAIARQAFSDSLPREITDRRTKGAMDAYCVRTFQLNRDRLRPYLLGGHLAAAGLLDRTQVEICLARPGPLRDDRFYRLLPVADMERWLRGWLGDPD